MTFFASRRNGAVEQQGGPSSTGIVASEPTGLPPWVESAVKKLLASVLPQFQPLVDKTEIVLADARETLAQQRKDQLAVLGALAELRQEVERLRLAIDAPRRFVGIDSEGVRVDQPKPQLVKRGAKL